MKIALIQIGARAEKTDSLALATKYIAEAAQNGADFAVLPEMFNCPYQTANFPIYAEPEGGMCWQAMSDAAREHHIYLVAGSMPEKDEAGHVYNTAYAFDREGKQIGKHRKMHLFDIAVKGGQTFRESDTLTAGNQVTTFDTEFGRCGLEICYDIRFPELTRAMAKRGAEVILCPAQFNMTTGPRHWELSVRARAMDNELFFVGASAARYNGFDYECWGHSTVADPFGMVRAACDETEQILYCNIDLNEVDSVREQLPTFLHLREDVYNVAK